MSRLEIFLRTALNVVTFAVIVAGLNKWIAAAFFLIGVAATTELAVRPHAQGWVEKLLLGCGAIVTTFILIGLCLNFTPWGLTRATWGVAWLIASIAVLIWRRDFGTVIQSNDVRSYVAHHWLLGLYGVAAMAVLVVAVGIALAGTRIWSQKAVLSFSLVSKTTNSVIVRVDATSTTGTYRVAAQSNSPHAHRYLSTPISVSADAQGQALDETVPTNVPGRWTIYLTDGTGSSDLRELIIDVG